MPATYDAIATTTLTSTSATVSFTSIPGTYTDLVLVVSAAMSASGQSVYMRFNDDTGSTYCQGNIFYNGTTFGTSTASMNDLAGVGNILYSQSGFSTGQLSAVCNIFNYADTSMIKSSITLSGQGASGTASVEHNMGWWNSANAITSITVRSNGTPTSTYHFIAGSTFSLYGILRG